MLRMLGGGNSEVYSDVTMDLLLEEFLITPAGLWPLFHSPRCEHKAQAPGGFSALICLIACSRPSLSLFQTFTCKSNALVFHNTSASEKPHRLQTHRPV